MSETKHTPTLPFRVSGGAGRLRTIEDAHGKVVCEVIGMNETGAELTARAHVHAAAPAMLAELESSEAGLDLLLRAIEEGDPARELSVRVRDMIASHRAAIAQAKGEAQ